MGDYDGISIIAACKDRNENLLLAIASWVGKVDEIIIVDWSSSTPVVETLNDILQTNSTIKIIEVKGQTKWVLSWAYNIALLYTNYKQVLKLDCDNILADDFFDTYTLTPGSFYTGNWQLATNDNEKHLNGVIYALKSDLLRVRGYNEYIQTYGWDDSDLYNRLKAKGLINNYITGAHISHIPHSDKLRSEDDLFSSIHYNRFLVQYTPWTENSKMSMFSSYPVNIIGPNFTLNLIRGTVDKVYAEVSTLAARAARTDLNNYFAQLGQTNPCGHWNVYCTGANNVMYINVRNGLGNKLRAMASAYSMYQYLNTTPPYNRIPWKFVVIWHRDEHCEAAFEDVYDIEAFYALMPGDLFVINDKPYLPSSTVVINGELISVPSGFEGSTVTPNNSSNISSIFEDIASSTTHTHLYIESASVINFAYSNWTKDCLFLRSLKPSASVQKYIDDTKAIIAADGLNIQNLVSVHIRLGQNEASYDDVSGWPLDKQQEWVKWRTASNYNNFYKKMQEELSKGTVAFYVASDTKKVYEYLERDFPGKVYYLPRNVWDRSKCQVITGLADALLLGSTRLFYGSNWSSFSELVNRLSPTAVMKLAGVDF